MNKCDIFLFWVLIDMGWKVFLPDRYIKPVEKKIHEIAGSVKDLVPDEGGLMGGKAGLACFCAYYADWSGDSVFDGLVADLIEQALNPAAGNLPDYSFSNGLSGIAWLIHHLSSTKLVEWDPTGIFDELDPYLYQHMITEIRSGHYDYLHGALGAALYFLRQAKNEKYRAHLTDLVTELERVAEHDADGGLKWLSVLDAETQKTGYNLSLSHGISSIVLILSHIYAEGISTDLIEQQIKGAIRYLEKQKLDRSEYISIFPSWAKESIDSQESSRLAWCYGDLGVGFAYYEAGIIFPGTAYKLDGLSILINSTLRRDPMENSVYDAGICHGASGIALIYNVLYQKTGLNTFKDAAIYWLDVCLNMAYHKDGIAGYKTWYNPQYGGWINTIGLLDGVSGIGLVLLSFISEREPSWSRSILL